MRLLSVRITLCRISSMLPRSQYGFMENKKKQTYCDRSRGMSSSMLRDPAIMFTSTVPDQETGHAW